MVKMEYTKTQQERLNQAEAELETLKQRADNIKTSIDNLKQKAKQKILEHKMESRQGRPAVGEEQERIRKLQRELSLCESNIDLQQDLINRLPQQFAKEQEIQSEVDQHIPAVLTNLHHCSIHLQKAAKAYRQACQEERTISDAAKVLPRHLISKPKRFPDFPTQLEFRPEALEGFGQRLEGWLSVESKFHGVKLEPDKELQADRKANQILDKRIKESEIKSAKENEEREERIKKFEKTKSGRALARAVREAQRQYEYNLDHYGMADERTRRSEAQVQQALKDYDRGLSAYEKQKKGKKKSKSR